MKEDRSPRIQDYSDFCPRKYYKEYYSSIGRENAFLLNFFNSFYSKKCGDRRVLEFGGGPTIYQIISAARYVSEIVFAEYLTVNREEVRRWLVNHGQCLDWDQYLDFVLRLEDKEISVAGRTEMRQQMRSKVTNIIECDALLPEIIGQRSNEKFDIVSSSFCLECIDSDPAIFIEFIDKISSLLEKNGYLALCMLKNAATYQIDGLSFPALPLDEWKIKSLLASMGFSEIEISTQPAEHSQGYDGIIALHAKKR